MKIHCPACNAAYTIEEERFSKPVIKATCNKCKTKMVIDRDSKRVQTMPEPRAQSPKQATYRDSSPETPQTPSPVSPAPGEIAPESTPPGYGNSVASMSPEYPKYRDTLIIGIVILIFVMVLGGGYFLITRTEKTLQKFMDNPAMYLAKLANVYETYDVCESFLRNNKDLFRQLGQDLKFSIIKEEVRVTNGKKTAWVSIKVQGSADTRDVLFRLNKDKEKWYVDTVALKLPNGRHQILYPRSKS